MPSNATMHFRASHLHTWRVYLALTIGPLCLAAGFAAMCHALDQVLHQVLPADSKLQSQVLNHCINAGAPGECCNRFIF